MTTPDVLSFHHPTEPEPTVNVAAPRKCRRHKWVLPLGSAAAEAPCTTCGIRPLHHGLPERVGHWWQPGPTWCFHCGATRDISRSHRGRTNRTRGNTIEREVARDLGLRRVGQYGGPEDAVGDWATVQVKSGGSFSERYWSWLQQLPVSADRLRVLVVTDAPGPGHRRRRIVVCDLDEFRQWYGR